MELHDILLPFELKIFMDEAGRGPLAGPVSVWSVLQCVAFDTSLFADSKKLTPKRREFIFSTMEELKNLKKLEFGLGFASAREIDEFGIIWSIQLASVRSLFQLINSFYEDILRDILLKSVWWEDHIFQIIMDDYLSIGTHGKSSDDSNTSDRQLGFLRLFMQTSQRQFVFRGLIRDGNHMFGLDALLNCRVQTIIKWDGKVPLIGAASIVAKVVRDRYMLQVDSIYPDFWFAKHKWYGTLYHREKITSAMAHMKKKDKRVLSILSPEHRLSYLKNFDRA